MFLQHFDVYCDLCLNRRTATQGRANQNARVIWHNILKAKPRVVSHSLSSSKNREKKNDRAKSWGQEALLAPKISRGDSLFSRFPFVSHTTDKVKGELLVVYQNVCSYPFDNEHRFLWYWSRIWNTVLQNRVKQFIFIIAIKRRLRKYQEKQRHVNVIITIALE